MPLATLWAEAEFVREGVNAVLSSHVVLIHAAIADAVGGGNHLNIAMEKLEDG